MARRLRLTTGVELDACDAPPAPAQLELAESRARESLSVRRAAGCIRLAGPPPHSARQPPNDWPKRPNHPGLWLALGHQHIGFSTAPSTAKLLAELMLDGRAAALHHAFRPAALCVRFRPRGLPA